MQECGCQFEDKAVKVFGTKIDYLEFLTADVPDTLILHYSYVSRPPYGDTEMVEQNNLLS